MGGKRTGKRLETDGGVRVLGGVLSMANADVEPSAKPVPARVIGKDGKSYPAQDPKREQEKRALEAVGEHVAEKVPESTNGPAYRESAKAIRQVWRVLEDIDPELAADGAERHEHSDLTMEKVDQLQNWLTTFRRTSRHLKVVEQ